MSYFLVEICSEVLRAGVTFRSSLTLTQRLRFKDKICIDVTDWG